jgi:gamma-glutamyltranspeptidase/glutathione hydrolase
MMERSMFYELRVKAGIAQALALGFFAACATPGGSTGFRPAVAQTPQERAQDEKTGVKFAISAQGEASARAAREILEKGGSLVDATIAASLVLSVERPHSTGIGGGGFVLYHDASVGRTYALDFRERSPQELSQKHFVDHRGVVDLKLAQDSALGGGVPGLIAGLAEMHRRWGKLDWKQLFEPAVRLAEEGFDIYPTLAEALEDRAPVLRASVSSRAIFMRPDGSPLRTGDRLIQKDLANTLREIAQEGSQSFYRGTLSKKIVKGIRRAGGVLQSQDLAQYQVKERAPLRAQVFGAEVISMPPPSSGGVILLQILKDLEREGVVGARFQSTMATHLLVRAFQHGFADRARYLGDPDFVNVPQAGLLSESYLSRRFRSAPLSRAARADEVSAGDPSRPESTETTHFSAQDASGNAIATTQSINGWMGSGVVVPGTGILWNNTIDDFAISSGANLYGALGGSANAISSGKTPLSSMTPTIVLKDSKPVFVLGAPGGTRIITCVAQVFLARWVYGLSLYESVQQVRVHHQWKPDVLKIEEPGLRASVERELRELGYQLERGRVHCRVMATERSEDGLLRAVTDGRDFGATDAL